MTTVVTATSRTGLSVALVSVVVVPQLGMSMITPGLTSVATEFETSTGAAQFVLVAFMAGYAVSMLLTGVLTDRFDPVRVQVAGLMLFVVASIVCAFAPNLSVLVIARFMQATGGCAGTVVARLIVQREYSEGDRMNLLTTLAAAIAVTPCPAPLAGVAILDFVGWRGVFCTVLVLAGVS
jgi:MFS transporter, DHA1 family, multidrug resistance protein